MGAAGGAEDQPEYSALLSEPGGVKPVGGMGSHGGGEPPRAGRPGESSETPCRGAAGAAGPAAAD